MLELLAETARMEMRIGRQRPRWLEHTREILHAQFADRLTISEIASAVGIHPVHLAAQFRRSYRCTIGDYLRRLRVELACRRISTSDSSFAEIALEAGFSDQSHLQSIQVARRFDSLPVSSDSRSA